jgi:hypothetical protein
MPQLRLLHIALCLSAAIIAVMFGALRSLMPDTDPGLPAIAGWILLGCSAAIIVSAMALRSTVPPIDSAAGEEAWLPTAKGKAILLWALCEGGVVLSALAFFFGAQPWVAGALAAGGLGFLASQSPGTLAGH